MSRRGDPRGPHAGTAGVLFEPDARLALLQGDALARLRGIPAGAIQLVVTSPPYNVGKEYEERTTLARYLADQRFVLRELARVLAPTGSLCWQVGNYVHQGEVVPLDVLYYPIIKSLGFRLRNRVVWHYGHGLHAKKRLSGRYETLLWFTRGEEYTFNLDAIRVPQKEPGKLHHKGPKKGLPSCNPLGKNPSDFWDDLCADWQGGVWTFPQVGHHHPEKTAHPAQYPVELAERCVLACSNPGEWVLDPYAGAGSTLVAALKHGRRAVGIDREPAYLDIARTRLETLARGELRTREIGAPIHQANPKQRRYQRPAAWDTEGA